MYRYFLIFLLFFSSLSLQAQTFSLQGKVLNSKQEAVPYASIRVKETGGGTISRADGSYQLNLKAGSYHLQLSMIGYKSLNLPVEVTDNLQKDIILEDESQNLSEVVIRAKIKDRAEEIIRTLVHKKEQILAAPGSFSAQLYIRAVQQDSLTRPREKQLKKGRLPDNPGNEFEGMAMSEIQLHLDQDAGGRIREERLGVRQLGQPKQLFYQSATDGQFNFYENLVKVPAISPTPFVSPVSNAGLLAYKFKTIKTVRTGKYRIYTISVKPREMANATVEGELTVSDSAWAILHCRFRFPAYHMQEYDFFQVEQNFSFVQDTAWMLDKEIFTYYTKGSKSKLSGQTTVVFSNYELHKNFPRNHFGRELSATAQQAYERDSAYWSGVRTQPLSEKEARFIHRQDSLYRITLTPSYQDSIDREINRITWPKIGLFGQSFVNRAKEQIWHLPSVLSMYQPVAYGGSRLRMTLAYSKTYASRKNLSWIGSLSYGLRNNDVNGSLELHRMYNPFNRGYFEISGGREFQFITDGDAWINMVKRNNVYLNNFISAEHGLELLNGLYLSTKAQIALRRSVADYKTGHLVDSLFGNYLDNNQAVGFEPYNAFYTDVTLKYTPGQQYRREPREKVILGSKWPTLYTRWRKGVPGILNSAVDFNYLEFGLEQRLNLGLIGQTRYTIKTGSFLNQRDLRLVDYQFERRGDPLLFMNPYKAFQALDSTFPVFNRFYEGHLVHEFNGLILNKIPLLKKLGLRELGGAGFLIAPERNLRYAELFAGVERAFQSPFNPLDKFKVGIYFVSSVANQFSNPFQIKLGFTTWDKRRNRWF